ncbi:methyl-accepting chemotaxis protein [Marinitoga hydrogenitolerans DSM 16785]|uniref:Methyl-accepting chemotaxis protein n=1 Tax=Marinitoga hydrogenitolerans (strain DSM 16785 / JCM 12826 / AT1271) TaxID=1122195 RepID=A0A1M4WVX4_MARH1|nr:cache domain-containing protein [Marinitoga hydrogenitolerans]SHE85307.1 methyl-accepting chemotaxis protein [Marinitoga hydrogenitolerans DSM 16785]
MSKISMKGLLNLVTIILLIISVFSIIYFFKFDLIKNISDPVSESIMDNLNERGNYISLYFKSEIEKLKLMPKDFSYDSTETGKVLKYLKNQLKKFPEFEEFFVANSDGESISSSNIFTNISRYRYFQEIFTNNKQWAISDIFTSKISGDVAIIIALEHYDNGKKYIFGGALNLKNVFLDSNKFKFKKQGELFFIDNLGTYFSVNNDGSINSGTFAKNFRENIIRDLKNSHGFLEVKKNKKDYLLFVSPINSVGWRIGFYIEKNLISPDFNKYYLIGLMFLIVLILLEVLFNNIILKKRFYNSIEVLKKELKKVNELNFDNIEINVKEPMFVDFSDNLQLTTVNLKENFNNFSRKINKLENNINETGELIKEEISRINEENETVEKLSKTFEAISQAVNDSQNVSENFKNKLSLYDEELEKLRHNLLKSKSKISLFNDLINRITDISEKVSDLSFRAEILSLNAALEASKEKGALSFAVIAADMRDMSYVLKDYNVKTYSHVSHIIENLNEYKNVLDELFKNIDSNISEIRKVTTNYTDIENFIKEYSISAAQVKNALNLLKLIINKNKNIMENIVESFKEIEKNYEELKKMFSSKKTPKNLEEIFRKLEEIEKKEETGSDFNAEESL